MMSTRVLPASFSRSLLAPCLVLAMTGLLQAQDYPSENLRSVPAMPVPAATPRMEPRARLSTAQKIPPEVISKWVSQLSSEQYGVRERATRQLLSAGPQALDAVAEAAGRDDLEASYRGVRILQAMLEDESHEVRRRAEAALEKIAGQEGNSAAGLADDALTFYQLSKQKRAIDSLRALKAAVYGDEGYSDGIGVALDKEWEGTGADLALLKEIPGLQTLSIRGVKLDAAALANLAELRQLVELKLYGTGVSAEGHEQLVKSLTDTHIDRRNALLGVGTDINIPGCIVTSVVADTAADKADIRPNDQIVSFGGKKVDDFEALTAMIATRQPGEQVTIEIRRDAETLSKQVTLGEWK